MSLPWSQRVQLSKQLGEFKECVDCLEPGRFELLCQDCLGALRVLQRAKGCPVSKRCGLPLAGVCVRCALRLAAKHGVRVPSNSVFPDDVFKREDQTLCEDPASLGPPPVLREFMEAFGLQGSHLLEECQSAVAPQQEQGRRRRRRRRNRKKKKKSQQESVAETEHQVADSLHQPAETLHQALLLVLKDEEKLLAHLQPLIHVLGGRFGSLETLSVEAVSSLVRGHPMFRLNLANAENTPLESCLLATAIVRLLCSQFDLASVRKAANFQAKSSGVFEGLIKEKPTPKGLAIGAIYQAKQRASDPKSRQTSVVSVCITDLVGLRKKIESFAHSFSVLIFPTDDGTFGWRIYQAFGPPQIGYSLPTCLESGTASQVLKAADLEDFKKHFETFEASYRWGQAWKSYQAMFKCQKNLKSSHPILPYVRVHTDVLDSRAIERMTSILLLQSRE